MFPASLFNSFPGNQKKTGYGMVKKNGRLLSKKNLITMADNPTPTETPVVTPPVAPAAPNPIATNTNNNRNPASEFMRIIRSETGQNNLSVTSLLRTGEQQASAMLKNYLRDPEEQRRLYGTYGQQVLDLFDKMKGKPSAEIVSAAGKLIDDLAKAGKYVSNHLYAAAAAKDVVTLDITLNSVKDPKALMKYLNKIGASKVLFERSNNCIHVEMKTGDMRAFIDNHNENKQNKSQTKKSGVTR
jgi:2-succinyl-5-enolpyruvyl-6-hydroxy-3-cyclohexene-1-carboxylate synthase